MARPRNSGTRLSAAEKQRRYRARRDADAQRRQEYLEKQREKWRTDIQTGKKKKQKDRTAGEQHAQRTRWREAHKRSNGRKKVMETVNTPPDTPEAEQLEGSQPGISSSRTMSSVWHQEPQAYSPCLEIDSSSVKRKDRMSSPLWLKQEQDDQDIIKWENFHSGTASDVVQDNTPSSAVSTASNSEGLPPRVLLTITKMQCMLESKQERIAALERQVEDLMQDRKFLRSQIQNLTSSRSMHAFAPPAVSEAAPKSSKVQHSDPKPRKRERASSSSSISNSSDSEASECSEMSGASSERRRKHHKDKRRGKKGKDYSRKRATGVQYVIHRYKQVLSAFIKKKNMSGAFRHHGVDRNTIANTASIAELHLAGEDIVPLVGPFRQGDETLVNYAQRCSLVIDSDLELSRKIDQMKANGELLPITGKRPRPLHSSLQQLGGAESILLG